MTRAPQIIALIAALHGAAGTALAAAAAHAENSAHLATASQFLMVHAGAGLALAALLAAAVVSPRPFALASFALQAGVTLFSLDLVFRVFASGRLFPYAAPIGGSLTILSWLALAGTAAADLLRQRRKAG